MRYSKEIEDTMASEYALATSDADRKLVVSKYVDLLKVSRQSVVSKLSSMGVYVKPARTTKSGEPVMAKTEYVNAIRILLGAKDHELESLEKASKRDLQVISDRLISLSEQVNLKG